MGKDKKLEIKWDLEDGRIQRARSLVERLGLSADVVAESYTILRLVDNRSLIVNIGPVLVRMTLNGKVKWAYFLDDQNGTVCGCTVVGKKIFMLSEDGGLYIQSLWGKEIKFLKLPKAEHGYCGLEASPDGSILKVSYKHGFSSDFWRVERDGIRKIVTGAEFRGCVSSDRQVCLHDFEKLILKSASGDMELQKEIDEPVFPCFSEDGKTLCVATGRNLLLFDTQTGHLKKNLRIGYYRSWSFSMPHITHSKLLPQKIENCDFRGAQMSDTLKDAIKNSGETPYI